MRMPISHTAISLFENCKLAFKRTRIDKMPQIKSQPMLVGSFFHDWADKYVAHLVKTKQQSDFSEAASIFEKMWAHRFTHKEHRLLPESTYGEIEGLINGFCETHLINHEQVAGTETRFAFNEKWEICNWMAEDVFFRMVVDRFEITPENVGHVFDYKTGYNVETQEEVANNPQMRRYVMGLSQVFESLEEYKVTLDYTRQNIVRTVTMPAGVAEAEKKRVMAISDQIEAALAKDEWEATPSEECAFCPVFNIKGEGGCPARELAEPFRAPQDYEASIEVMKRLIIVERERKDLTAMLKAWGDFHGAVVTGGLQYGPSRKERLDFDTEAAIEWGKEYGVDLTDFMKVSNSHFKKAIKALEKAAKGGDDRATSALAAIPVPDDNSGTEYRLKKAKA